MTDTAQQDLQPTNDVANNQDDDIVVAEQTGPTIESLQQEIATLKDQLLRAVAEAENTRRRAERDIQDGRKYAVSQLARDMLSVADNLARALAAAVPTEGESAALTSLRQGIDMTARQLEQTLMSHGVTNITPQVGDKFDPSQHQAVFEVEQSTHAPGTIGQVIQAGAKIHDRLLRPAMVGVVKHAPTDAAKIDTKA